MSPSSAPREPVWPRPPITVDGLVLWARQLTRELNDYFQALSAVRGAMTPRSGTPFIANVEVAAVTDNSVLSPESMVVELTTFANINPATPVRVHEGQPGQTVILTNVSNFSITLASGTLSVTLALGESTMLRWSVPLGRWTKVA